MPFESEAQRRFMFAKHPKIAEEFAKHTPKDADLPEHVKMAEGGEVRDPVILEKIREILAKRNAPISEDVNDMSKADQVTENMAKGGEVMDPKDVIGLPGVPNPDVKPTDPIVAKGLPGVPALPGTEPSHDEKVAAIQKAMEEGRLKMANGGDVDPSELPMPADAPQESKLQAILKAMGMAGNNLANSPAGKVAGAFMSPLGALKDAVMSPTAQDIVSKELSVAKPAVASLAGVPQAPAQAPSAPPAPAENPAPLPNPPSLMAPTPAAKSAPAPDPLAGLTSPNPDTATQGFNPADRQALANTLNQNQHTFGNYLAEALGGIGDAVAAKGGVRQNALGDIFALQTQQRQEALDNFDKARMAAVEHFNMKNQANQNLINNLKARGELVVSPAIAQALGHPELANKPTSQADLVLKTDAMRYDFANKMTERKQNSLKNAADEIDKALTHGGIAGSQKMMDPQSRLRMIHAQAIKNDPEAFGYQITEGK